MRTSSSVLDLAGGVRRCQVLVNWEERKQGARGRQLPPGKKKKPAPPIVFLRKEIFVNVKLSSAADNKTIAQT